MTFIPLKIPSLKYKNPDIEYELKQFERHFL